MEENHSISTTAQELNLTTAQVRAVERLLREGGTVPFIARYRKEATGSLDEVAITAIRDTLTRIEELDRRKHAILKSLEERQLLTPELREKLLAADTSSALEDIYLPYRPKRRTKASMAKEKGLEPLAAALFAQNAETAPSREVEAYVDPSKGVTSTQEALTGSRHIMAEWISESREARQHMRSLFEQRGLIRSRVIPGQEEAGAKFRDYFEWEESVTHAPSHRILAVRRGEKEGVLNLRITPPEEAAIQVLEDIFLKPDTPAAEEVTLAIHDGYRRLLSVSMETEIRLNTKKEADNAAIKVFAENMRALLLTPPLGQKRVLAVDPGIRTGCKVACLNRQGRLIDTATLYLSRSERERAAAAQTVTSLVSTYDIEAVAVGNGTAGRETEAFIRGLGLSQDIPVVMVNESGASVYSASAAARAEFPDLDLTFRGAVSIGRRLMDPLAELVKIEPKAIGVGQYQHDVNQQALKKSLDDVVMSCVNAVGVDVNTASEQLLTYVSGLGPQLARNVVAYRNETGAFTSREQLKAVPRLGPRAFEQAAGFLRIPQAQNPLDASAVHPESYGIVEAMARDLGCHITDLLTDKGLRDNIDPGTYVSETVGLPTLMDILSELEKPGRDPREKFEHVHFTQGVDTIEDIKSGMRLSGVVTNVTGFGAFVDIGVHQDGLVHISQLADRFVKNPGDVVKVHQQVQVTVLDVDLERNRISLSMKPHPESKPGKKERRPPHSKAGKRRPDKRKPETFNNPFQKAFG